MMELNDNINIMHMQQDLCRLCDCEVDEHCEMFSIFDKNEDGLEIISLIQDCLQLNVGKSDPLSKNVCAECLEKLENLLKFKKKSFDVAFKYEQYHLQTNGVCLDEKMEDFLGFEKDEIIENSRTMSKIKEISDQFLKLDAQTSTEDLIILCTNCKSEILESFKVENEMELCNELHQAIAESFCQNNLGSNDNLVKNLRVRKKKGPAFYHELEDSLCSSMTELTNTETQIYDLPSDVDVSEDSEQPSKRIKIDFKAIFEEKFKEEEEYQYNPVSLLQLCLNVINRENIPEFNPENYVCNLIEPVCSCCGDSYKNCKLLALHEVNHMSIELGDKVDSLHLWHESRDFADIRNKWMTNEENDEDEASVDIETVEEETVTEMEPDEENLLIPVSSSEQGNYDVKSTREVTLIDGKPYVDGLPLSDYPKEERRSFYHSMRINGVNKRFCTLCRYSFKDNWAIESHYFSMACYYTCRYCGMRFNKQRIRFDDHVEQHLKNGDTYSTKVFAASKNNNFVPKILSPKSKINGRDHTMSNEMMPRKILPKPYENTPPQQQENFNLQTSQSKTGNQAYFCRKCYKVFFKLDEFNIHSKNCDYSTQFPNSNIHYSKSAPNGESVKATKVAPVKEPNVEFNEHNARDQMSSTSQGPFVCYICNTPFPTVYSRNSHMRIHKAENMNASAPPSANANNQVAATIQQFQTNYMEDSYQNTSLAQYAQVKEEPLEFEPEVEIHETQTQDFTTDLGPAISITPITKNPNQKLQINPDVMKLVQNNPQLSIKNNMMDVQQNHMQQINQMFAGQMDPDRTYKCSSCWEAFANKSHLYFHKKNQCEGSKYPCPFCKKRFGTEAAYSSHIFYSHPE